MSAAIFLPLGRAAAGAERGAGGGGTAGPGGPEEAVAEVGGARDPPANGLGFIGARQALLDGSSRCPQLSPVTELFRTEETT